MAEQRFCPHCNEEMEYWLAPPESGWGYIYICFNNQCEFYRGSVDEIENKGEDKRRLGCRYAEDPSNYDRPVNILAYCPF